MVSDNESLLQEPLVLRPAVIIADEPVSMLDVSVRAGILELMKDLKDRFRISYLYITHDLSTSRYIGDKIAIMYAGKIVEMGAVDTVLLNPLHPYTQALIDAVSEPNPTNLQETKYIRIREGRNYLVVDVIFIFDVFIQWINAKKSQFLTFHIKPNNLRVVKIISSHVFYMTNS